MKTYEATPHKLKMPAACPKAAGAGAVSTTTTTSHEERKVELIKVQEDEKTATTCHKDCEEEPTPDISIIQRHDIIFTKHKGGAAFVLQNFLTPNECQDFIHQAEMLGLSHCGYSKRIRQTRRVAAASNEVARVLFDRLKPFLSEEEGRQNDNTSPSSNIDLSRKLSTAWYPEGVSKSMRPYDWHPMGLNPTFRICRYDKGGFFFPHHDGGFFVNEFHQSIKTFMVYLNDDFEGGETRFYNELQRHYQKPDPDHAIYSYRPRAGDALIFNSHITHDGGRLLNGQKYIMRSEIMYHAPAEEEEALLRP